MAKILTPQELAEIATLLLVKPDLLGQLEEMLPYGTFLRDMAQLIEDTAGGEIHVNQAEYDSGTTHFLSVRYDDESLASPAHNAYMLHDAMGFEDEESEDEYELPSERECELRRIAAALAPIAAKLEYEQSNGVNWTPPTQDNLINLTKSDIQELIERAQTINDLPVEQHALKHLAVLALQYQNQYHLLSEDTLIPYFLTHQANAVTDVLSPTLHSKIITALTTQPNQ